MPKSQDRVESLKTLSADRGIVRHPTNINPDQVKSQLPIFTGTSSLFVIDAIDTLNKIPSNAGIHRQMWGGIMLRQHSRNEVALGFINVKKIKDKIFSL